MTDPWSPPEADPTRAAGLAACLGLRPLAASLLASRGLSDPARAREFLDRDVRRLHDPRRLPGLAEAADRVGARVAAGDLVCVYGDYDVDGCTGTAILCRTISLLGGRVLYYVPHRTRDGYGPNARSLSRLAALGVRTVVTVDCGIAAPVEVLHARKLGLEVVVTDHHEPKGVLPDADVLVHCRLRRGEYPWGGLCGAATAFKLAQLLLHRAGADLKNAALGENLALAALGTVADVVPLLDENRAIVHHGLEAIARTSLPGLRALLAVCKLEGKALDAGALGFQLGPRVNAVGRLGCARHAVDLLLSRCPEEARRLAGYADALNAQRKEVEKEILAEARPLADAGRSDPALVLRGSGWHSGVVGIVAARLAEEYGRPVVLCQDRPGGTLAGSGRSVPGVPLHEDLAACGDLLLAHGGHAQAVGLKLEAARWDAFRGRLCEAVARRRAAPHRPRGAADAEATLAEVDEGLLADLARLGPFGAGNPEPVFLARDVSLAGFPRRMGADQSHLSFDVTARGARKFRCVAFGKGPRHGELERGAAYDLLFRPKINEWSGRRNVELDVQDWRPSV